MEIKLNLKIKKSVIKSLTVPPPLSKTDCLKIRESIRMQKVRKRYNNPSLKKMYDLSNLPQKDKERLRPSHNKFQAANSIPSEIQKRSKTHIVYDFNITFIKNHRPKFYTKFFYYLCRIIDRQLNIDYKDDARRTEFVLIKERKPMIHYHGFLLIHKSKEEKFHKACVLSVVTEHDKKKKVTRETIYLKRTLLTPPSQLMKEMNLLKNRAEKEIKESRPRLSKKLPFQKLTKEERAIQIKYLKARHEKDIAEDTKHDIREYEDVKSLVLSHELYKLTDVADFFKKNAYNVKHFVSDKSLSTDDIVFEAKPTYKPKPKK